MTHIDWLRGLPPEDLAKLLDCPNNRLCRGHSIPCTRNTTAHDSCGGCIARFLRPELPEGEEHAADGGT